MTKLKQILLGTGLALILLTPVSQVFLFLGFMLISITLSLGAVRLFHPHTHITGQIKPRTTEDHVPPPVIRTQGEPPTDENNKNFVKKC